MMRKSLLCLVLAALLAASGCAAPEDAQSPGVRVAQGDQTVTPYENFLWCSDGKVVACGTGMSYLLPDLARELPMLDRNAAFEIGVPENGKLLSFSVYDGAFDRTHHNISEAELPAAVAAAPGNTCYVVFEVIYQGEYIPWEDRSESSGCEYAFALAWDEEPALAAWAPEPEDVAYIERFDGSTDPGTPSYVWAADARVAEALTAYTIGAVLILED